MEVEKTKVKCSDCGCECEVPFKPTEGRPVYCNDCFAKHKPKRSFGGQGRSFGNREGNRSFGNRSGGSRFGSRDNRSGGSRFGSGRSGNSNRSKFGARRSFGDRE